MTELEWLACADGGAMFDFLWDDIGWRKLSNRKLGFFAAACARLTPEGKLPEGATRNMLDRIEVAERYLDGKATVEEVRRVWPLRYCHDPYLAVTWPEDSLAWSGSYRACEIYPSNVEKAIF